MKFIRRLRAAFQPPQALLNAGDMETRLAISLLHTIASGIVLWSLGYFLVFLPLFVARKAVAGGMAAAILGGAVAALFMLYRGASNGEALHSPDILKRQVRRASWVLIGVITVVVMAYIILDGGAQSRALFLLVATAVAALVLLGQRVATFFFCLFLALTLGLTVLQHFGISMPRYFPGHPVALWYAVVLVTALIAYPLTRTFATLREAIRQVRENEEGLRTILETAPDGVFILNGDGRVMEVNQSALRQLGYSREELLGMSLMDFVPPELREQAARHFPEMKGPVVSEGVHLCKDGTRIPVEVNARRITFRGEPGMLGIARDITDRKRAEEQRMQLERRLQQAQRLESLGRFAGGVAHDFNNLLTVINGQSRLGMAQMPATDPLQRRLEQILKAGESAAGLTRQLLAFSRQQVLKASVIDLNTVVEGIRTMLGPMMGDDVEVRFDLHAGVVPVFADAHQLEQVILNLAVNARDAMPEGGQLNIATRNIFWGDSEAHHPEWRSGPCAVLTVTDNGAGMDEAIRQKIFEPFFTTKETGMGTGLGLAMVQGIVTQSGGYIEVDSRPGQGTTFRIYLPLRSGEEIRTTAAAVSPERAGGETVLVVEDRAEVRQYVADVLRSYGYEVIETASGEEALKHCDDSATGIDIVLADVVMAGMSGVDLVAHLTNRRPGTKALLMSGYTDRPIPQMATNGPGFLQKPFSPEELAEKVRAILAR